MANALYDAFSGDWLSEYVLNNGPDKAFNFLRDFYGKHMDHKIVDYLTFCECFDPPSHGEDIGQLMWGGVIIHLRNFSDGKIDGNYKQPYNFLFTIGRRLCIKHLTKEKRCPTRDIDEVNYFEISSENAAVDGRIIPGHFIDPQIHIETEEEFRFAVKALEALSEEQGQLIRQVHVDGMTHLQISMELNISEVAARKRYSRALRALRLKYREAGGKNGRV